MGNCISYTMYTLIVKRSHQIVELTGLPRSVISKKVLSQRFALTLQIGIDQQHLPKSGLISEFYLFLRYTLADRFRPQETTEVV